MKGNVNNVSCCDVFNVEEKIQHIQWTLYLGRAADLWASAISESALLGRLVSDRGEKKSISKLEN